MRQARGAALADQHPGLHQGAHALLQEEGVALGARNQEPLEGRQAGIVAKQGLQELVGAGGRQRVEAQLRVVRLAAPAMLILGSVVDQQQEPGRGQALDQAVEQGLRFGVDPVQVFKHQQQRLHLTFAQQHALEGLEQALATLRRVEAAKRTVVREHLQQGQERRDSVLKGLVQREDLPGHLGAYSARVIGLLDVRVALQQVDHGEVRRGLPIGHRGTLQDPPALGLRGVETLIDETGLPDAGLPDHRHHLPVPCHRTLQGLPQGCQLWATAHKACQATRHARLQAATQGTRADQFEDVNRRVEPFHRHWPHGGDAHQTFHQVQGGGGQQDTPRCRQLFHARRQMRGLANGGVVHV